MNISDNIKKITDDYIDNEMFFLQPWSNSLRSQMLTNPLRSQMLTRMFIINSRTSSIWDKKDIKIECFFDSMEYNDISRNITKDFYNHIIYPKICKLYNEYINDENTDMLKIFKII